MKRSHFSIVLALFIIAALSTTWILWLGDIVNPKPHNVKAADRMELRFFINSPEGIHLPPAGQDFVLQMIEEKFNVNLKIEYMLQGNDYNSRLAALLYANNPPDMWLEMNTDGGSKYALDELLADMTAYVSPVSMPNYFQFWVTEQELKDFQIHNRFYRAPIPYDKNSFRSYYIRADWLEKLQLNIPRTYDEYVKVLRAFTFDDPDNDGLNNTFGFTTSGNSSSLSTDWPEYVKNGLIYPAYMKNNKLIDMETDPQIGQVVDDILKVVNEGLIDPDWFLNQETEHIDKAVQGNAGIVLGDTQDFALDANPRSIQSRSRALNPNANWVPFNPFGSEPLRAGIDPGYPFVFSRMTVDLNPEKVTKIVEILDWLAGPEGFLLTHYGLEGTHYTRSGNTITLQPIDKAAQQPSLDFLKIWDFFTPEAPNVLGLQVINPELTERDKEIKLFLAQLPVKEKLGTALTPPLGIDVGAFRDKQNEFQVKMLFSDKSGRNWPQYREEIMTKYFGAQILRNFEDQIHKIRGTAR
ncbi:extracellular solute-binding protein [Paenibacillus eucommiae]|uniref:Extracellular solute-binding protein n=1 Tax=Paenibacillus eucommiae TaxID=1355755 RepID=A0ABS4J1U8_9BACL|nr:extracellular solute-binding protein [Paenibacillus eucommiae]MBP1993814.1 hypothetical protein [Paenibacillus eucommiae]